MNSWNLMLNWVEHEEIYNLWARKCHNHRPAHGTARLRHRTLTAAWQQEGNISKATSSLFLSEIIENLKKGTARINKDQIQNPYKQCKQQYEDCSNMNASSFITFFTYMLRQNVIPFWNELFVVFRMASNVKKHSLYFSSYRRLYKGHSCILKFFLEQIAIHVLVHVPI